MVAGFLDLPLRLMSVSWSALHLCRVLGGGAYRCCGIGLYPVWRRLPPFTMAINERDTVSMDTVSSVGTASDPLLQLSTWEQLCISCHSSSGPKGAYGTTDEALVVLTCAYSCD